ncbi:MAG: NAD+ synthase [Bacteroidota bacterium]
MEISSKATDSLNLHTPIVRKILVEFIRDEVKNAGFGKVVIGLSGGVDSALVAFLAVEALGKENVTAVTLPYKTSNPASLSDAHLILKKLGLPFISVDITPMVDPFIEGDPAMDAKRKGNVMARERMIVLYDISARENALVLGTSNKSELLLGYGTLFGDLACAINPIGDLYKTQVWQLAEAISVPKAIVDKKPSADLWTGQTDEGEFGFTYKEVDQLFYQMIDERRNEQELAAMGFEKSFIQKVQRLVQQNQFKRRPPLIAKISHRTINIDYRYPRDWGL